MAGRCTEIKVKRLRQKAVDREERASVIERAKPIRGPRGQTVSN
jgi:hypothetical protein